MHTTGLPNGNVRAWDVGVWHLIAKNTLILLPDSEHTRRSPVHVLRRMYCRGGVDIVICVDW